MACTIVFPKFIKNLLRSTLQSEYYAPLSDINNGDFALLFQKNERKPVNLSGFDTFSWRHVRAIYFETSRDKEGLWVSQSIRRSILTPIKKNKKYKLNNCIYSRGVLMKILGGGVPSGSPNPGPISDQKMSFSTPVFRPGGGHKTQH